MILNKPAFVFFMILLASSSVCAVKPTPAEMRLAHEWAMARFRDGEKGRAPEPPFTFVFGGHSSSDILKNWKREMRTMRMYRNRTAMDEVFTDPASGMVVTCRAVEWRDFPTVEWTVDFKNTGKADSPILSDIRPLDVTFTRTDTGEFQLHTNSGDDATVNSYAPHVDTMAPGAVKQTASAGGRPTTGGYPYWNIEMPGGGVIAVLSWGGQWSAEFKRDGAKTLRVRAGQELTHFILHPGEEVRSPLAILQFYQGDWIRSQNIWRRWMLADNCPRINGKLPLPLFESNSNGYFPGLRDTLADEEMFVDKFVKEKIGVGFWDLDAGWYPGDQTKQWWEVGTWEPDTTRFPGGVKALSNFMHARGIKLILWFEPERVYSGTWLAKNHPEWIYGGAKGGVIKLGEPDCFKWVLERIDSLITSQGVDVYRQDFNIDPLAYWRGNDAPDRQGITEIRHIEAYGALWDELRRRHPNLIIDSCASGGRRNTVETLRRSVPILRSDDQMVPLDEQCHTYGISPWVPINGTGLTMSSDYAVRSCMASIFGIAADVRQPVDWERMRRLVGEWRNLSRCMLGDYYPLTPYSQDKKDWIAWQWDVPESGEGMIQAFRRDDATADSMVIKLAGLDARAAYTVTNLDSGKSEKLSGRRLTEEGLTVGIPIKPGSALISYKKS
ncbi:MAG: alpha-galactosidase [Fimbriimonadales bacterium]